MHFLDYAISALVSIFINNGIGCNKIGSKGLHFLCKAEMPVLERLTMGTSPKLRQCK